MIVIIESIVISLLVAKYQKLKLKPFIQSWNMYALCGLLLLYIGLTVSTFLGFHWLIQYRNWFQCIVVFVFAFMCTFNQLSWKRFLVKSKPKYITIEDLNVKGMMKNRHLSKAIAQQNFYYFRTQLESKCKQYGIELRIVSRWYPSSKTCACCGYIKKDLKLSDRVYICEDCGFEIDRDLNAAINLMNAKEYTIAC